MARPFHANGRRNASSCEIDFAGVNRAALPRLATLVRELAPNGKRIGREWVALNPTRPDRRIGSFKINLKSGRWADFATGDRGGDVVSLVAYVMETTQGEAARYLDDLLGGGR